MSTPSAQLSNRKQEAAAPDEREDARLRRRIFFAAFAVRLLYILLAHTYRIRMDMDHFNFGWEMGRIGRSLAEGRGYGNPFTGITGPSAWAPPLYTLLIGAVFRVLGVYTAASAFVLEAVNSAVSAWTAVLVFEIGRRVFGRRTAMWSGWLWALHPAAMQYAVRWIWEMTATTALFAYVLLLTLRMGGLGEAGSPPRQSWRDWSLFGLAWGALVLMNPSPLTMFPVMALFALVAARDGRRRFAGPVLAGVLLCSAVTPWAARNWIVFHRFIPLRDNFGAENYMGNGPWSTGFPWGTTVPLENRRFLREVATMGEPAWTEDRGRKATLWIRQNPSRFAGLSGKRAYMYWAGVSKSVEEGALVEYGRLMDFQFLSLAGLLGVAWMVRQRLPGWPLFVASVLLLPLPYYLVTVQARFRHTLEPLLFLLGVHLFASAEPGRLGRAIASRFPKTMLGRRVHGWAPWFRGSAGG